MAKLKQKRSSVSASSRHSITPSSPGSELLRRILLGLATTLIVARPLVQGEDPGRLLPWTSMADLVLGLLWLTGVVGWAIWRIWSRNPAWYAGPVEAALLGVVGFVFLSAGVAAKYPHPAWLVAWEWAVLLAAFFLVRQLAVTPGENQSLLAAVLATGVTVALFAVYQWSIELPRQRALSETAPYQLLETEAPAYLPLEPEAPRPEAVALLGWTAEPAAGFPGSLPLPALILSGPQTWPETDARVLAWRQRLEEGAVSATFASPDALADYLTLLLPILAGAVLACWRLQAWSPRTVILLGLTALLGAGLWLAHSWLGFLALFLVGVGSAGVHWRRSKARPRGWSLAGLLGLGALAVLRFPGIVRGEPSSGVATLQTRLQSWERSWAVIGDHFWLGVGPGNFARAYPGYLLSAAFEPLSEPSNFFLEILATCGVFALGALLAMLTLFFWYTWSSLGERSSAAPPETVRQEQEPRIAWEFYMGGVAGLILAFLLRLVSVPTSEILREGVMAGLRSLVWFVLFALFETTPWPAVGRARAVLAGVGAVVLMLLVSPGIGFPSLMQPVVVLMALALNAVAPRPISWLGRQTLGLLLPLPLLVAVFLSFLLLVFIPSAGAANSLAEAHRQALVWRNRGEAEWRRQIAGKPIAERATVTQRYSDYLERNIIKPLEEAAVDDPGNAAVWVELAHWHGKQAMLTYEVWANTSADERRVAANLYRTLWQGSANSALDAIASRKEPGPATIAWHLDPQGKEGYLAECRLRLLTAQFLATLVQHGEPKQPEDPRQPKADYRQKRLEQLQRASNCLSQAAAVDPTDPQLRYLWAEVFRELNDWENSAKQAALARQLDQEVRDPRRRLSERQRHQVALWTAPAS